MRFLLRPLILLVLIYPQLSFAQSALAVLEYHQNTGLRSDVQKFTDRLREEFIRRGEIATLSKEHTEEIFYYHRPLLTGTHPYEDRLREGKQAYYELRLKEAEDSFRDLIRRADNTAGRDDGTLLESHLLLGLTLAAEKDEEGARASFREALQLNPNLQINTQFFSPKIVKLFREVAHTNSSPKGILKVHSQPEGGKVYLNSVLAGVTPLEIPAFPVGRHALRIEAGPRQSAIREVVLRESRPTEVNLPLGWRSPPGKERVLGFTSQEATGKDQLVQLAAQSGTHLGVQKILLVSLVKGRGELRLIDTSLRASYQLKTFDPTNIQEQSAELAAQLTTELTPEVRSNLLVAGSKKVKVEDRYSGDVLLLGHYRRPLYKRPLFWVGLGLAGAGGGIGAALVGAGAVATGSLAVAF